MAPSLSLRGLLMVVICSLAVFSLAQTLDTLYVKPTPDTTCDEDPCFTLMEYVDNSSQYFTRDTEAVFLSGQHLLGRNIWVINVAIFIMRKEINASQPLPEIVCTAPVGLAFASITNVSITGLSFVACGDIKSTAPAAWVVLSYSVHSFVMANSTVKMANASVVYTFNSTFHSLSNHFKDNADRTFGTIFAIGSIVSIENSLFYNNSALGGGVMIAFDSETVFRGENIFAANKAIIGGGMFLDGSNVSFEGSNTFIHNSATLDGGAIRSEGSVISFNGNTLFMNNSASAILEDEAAVLSSFNDIVTFTGNTTVIGNGPSATTLTFSRSTAVIEGIFTFKYNQGGIIARSSNVTIDGTAHFINNSGILGPGIGSTLSVHDGSRLAFNGNTLFTGNNSPEAGHGTAVGGISSVKNNANSQFSASDFSGGSAVAILDSEIAFSGVNSFTNNKAEIGGGVYIIESIVSFAGSSTFVNNSANQGAGAIASLRSAISFNGSTSFMDNSVSSSMDSAAAALNVFDGNVSFIGNTTFIRNGPSPKTLIIYNSMAAFEGFFTFDSNQGELIVLTSNVTIKGTANFINNTAVIVGGNALAVYLNSRLTFFGTTFFSENNAIQQDGFGAIHVVLSTIQFMGHTTFTGHSDNTGAVIFAVQANIEFDGTQSFENNVASVRGGAIFMLDSMVNMKGYSSFIDNSAGRQGGAISNANGLLNITGNADFIGNQAPLGGGLYFEFISHMFLISPLELSFQHNSAQEGGAIYVSDETNNVFCFNDSILTTPTPTSIGGCFVQIESLSSDIQLGFAGNTASNRGDNVFGGMLDKCVINADLVSPVRGLTLLTSRINTSTIASEPLRLCFCLSERKNCSYDPPPFSIVRGGTISLPAVALDQTNRTVAATIRSYFPYNNETVSDFSLGQGVQQIGAACTPLNYTVLTTASYVTIVLYAEGPCTDIGNSQRQISVHLGPCPIAFELSDTECICEVRLQSFTNSCSAESQTFSRNTDFWVGTEYRDDNYTGLILHSHCPLDYCISNPADISVNDLDSQCSFNRSGILCGACQQNLSLALGSSQCLQCSNYYLALLVPFAVAGVALVFILFILQLTVSKGTLNGLIFYVNMIAVNKDIFFPQKTATNILTVFLAWLNLDLGIETCFFNGMDTYARTWLQYVFPFYIWLMVSIIIVVSHYSVRVPKLFSRNPIAVLATLFLLSYTKLLRTIIATFSATVLDYPGNSTDTVWLYDSNIRYLRGKHIPLFLFSLVILLFLFLPYTVFLFISQWLQALSNEKYLFWVNRLRMKTFLDAYHAPYNITHRYWTGLLMLLRCVLCLVFASNTSGDPSVNLLAISSVALGLAMSTRVIGQVYSKWWLDILEGSFILNLGITAAATYHVMQSGGDQSAVAYISVSVALVEFAGIVIYVQLKYTSAGKKARNAVIVYLFSQKSSKTDANISSAAENKPSSVPVTVVSLSELCASEPVMEVPSQ